MRRCLPKMCLRDRVSILRMLRILLEYVHCEMIILYGSPFFFNGGKGGVSFASRVDSDFCNFLIVISTNNVGSTYSFIERAKWVFDELYGDSGLVFQFLVEHINSVNRKLAEGRLFISSVKRDGVLLYDSCAFRLNRRRRVHYERVWGWAEEDFRVHYGFAMGFFRHALYAYRDRDYVLGAFMLHQTAEHFYQAINLVFTNDQPKSHDLYRLRCMTLCYSPDLSEVFVCDSSFSKRCFSLLCRAYIEARYNRRFKVKKKEFEYMNEQICVLEKVCKSVCFSQIGFYRSMVYSGWPS